MKTIVIPATLAALLVVPAARADDGCATTTNGSGAAQQAARPRSTSAHAARAGRSSPGKPGAPVTVQAALDVAAGKARVTVQFDSAATDVRITAKGLDGLAVTSPSAPVTADSVAAQEVRAVDVAFTPGEGRSQLVVTVTGRFGGARRATAKTFGVGEETAAQKAAGPRGRTVTDAQGNRIKVMPAPKE